jgi:predicted nucleic acid-binding protein
MRALQFINLIEALAPLQSLAVGSDEQEGGIRMLRKFSDQNLSLTDAIGLHMMQHRRLVHCWSTDRHLGLTGVRLAIEER